MKEHLSVFPSVFMARFGTLAMATALFLPPDAQNPHVLADVIGILLGAFFWTLGDLTLANLAGKNK